MIVHLLNMGTLEVYRVLSGSCLLIVLKLEG